MNTPAQSSETAQKQTKHPTRHRIQFLFISIIALVAISAAGGLWYHHLHRYIPGKITFQEYEPGYLPSGKSITQKTIEAWYIPAGQPARYTALKLQLKDGSYIYQEEDARNFTYACAATAENETCSVGITPRGQRYVLRAYTLQGQAKEHSVEWLEGKTDVIFVLDSTNEDGYSQKTLEKIIDSFKPVEYKGLEVRYIDKSTI